MSFALRAGVGGLVLCLFTGLASPLAAAPAVGQGSPALISLIIDDLGDGYDEGKVAINLPGALTYSILPRTTYSRELAEMAHAAGKEVMLHQPMEAMNGKAMGPGGISLAMTRRQLRETLAANLASVPYVRGINNHMGSLLTRQPEHMAWVMEAMRERGDLYFVDSTTTRQTIARRVARDHGLPNLRRNIFLDHERDPQLILSQFYRLVEQAKHVGLSLAIAHPYPETMAVLKKVLPRMNEFGVELVSVSELLDRTVKRREELWQASLSHSQRDAKN
jgi:polysaccharide deacetylase 2 family uncharacterized protein YibQ